MRRAGTRVALSACVALAAMAGRAEAVTVELVFSPGQLSGSAPILRDDGAGGTTPVGQQVTEVSDSGIVFGVEADAPDTAGYVALYDPVADQTLWGTQDPDMDPLAIDPDPILTFGGITYTANLSPLGFGPGEGNSLVIQRDENIDFAGITTSGVEGPVNDDADGGSILFRNLSGVPVTIESLDFMDDVDAQVLKDGVLIGELEVDGIDTDNDGQLESCKDDGSGAAGDNCVAGLLLDPDEVMEVAFDGSGGVLGITATAAVVPLPPSLALLGGGVAALALLRRRRSARSA